MKLAKHKFTTILVVAARAFLVDKVFGSAGEEIVIEEMLEGPEGKSMSPPRR
jgi:phosphoribosylamine-glycine ligase